LVEIAVKYTHVKYVFLTRSPKTGFFSTINSKALPFGLNQPWLFSALQSVRITHFREDWQGNVCQGNGKKRLPFIPLTIIPLTLPAFSLPQPPPALVAACRAVSAAALREIFSRGFVGKAIKKDRAEAHPAVAEASTFVKTMADEMADKECAEKRAWAPTCMKRDNTDLCQQ